MLTFSHDQLARFQARSETNFHARLFAFLRSEFPDFAGDDVGLASVVEVGTQDARDAGLRGERAIVIYVMMAFLLGMDVKDDPEFIGHVRESGSNEAEKIAWMESFIEGVATGLDQ